MTSTAITKVMDSTGENAKVLFRLQHTINHSPVGADKSGTRIGASSIRTTLMTDTISDPKVLAFLSGFDQGVPFEMNTNIKLTGEVENKLILNSFYHSAEGDTLAAEGGNFSVFSDATGGVQGSGNLGLITLTTKDGTVSTVSPSMSSFDLSRVSEAIYNGSISFDMPKLNVQNSVNGLNVELSDINLSSEQTMTDNILSNQISLAVDQIQSPLPIDSASWQITTDGYSLERMEKFNEISQTNPMIPNDSLDPMVTMKNDLSALKALVAPGVGMNTSVVVTNSGGSIGASLNLGFIGDGTATGYDSVETIRDLVMAMTGRILLDADAEALMQTPAAMFLMDPAIGQYVLNDGSKYTTDIKMADLTLYTNGQAQSLEDLVGPMLYMPLNMGMFEL